VKINFQGHALGPGPGWKAAGTRFGYHTQVVEALMYLGGTSLARGVLVASPFRYNETCLKKIRGPYEHLW